MKKILIATAEIIIGILFIVLIISGIKYRQDILAYIGKKTTPTASLEVIKEKEPQKQEEIVNIPVQEEKEEEPPKEEEVEEQEPEVKTTKMVFTGDILLTGYLLSAYDNKGIDGIIAPELSQEMKQADLTMINQEFPFSNRGTAMEDKQFTFRIEPSRVNVLQDLGVDIVTLANNHVLDYGQEALIDTFDTLNEASIQYVGAGNNYGEAKQRKEFELNGKKVGILGASRVLPVAGWAAGTSAGVFSTYDPKGLVEEIKTAKESCDVVIVFVHWGIEKNEYPEEYQRQLGKNYIDAGADLVIGAHPHVLQGIEYYNGKPIVYSLGNFIFGSQIPKTALLKVEMQEDASLAIAVEACATNAEYVLNKASNAEEIYEYITNISTNAIVDSEGNITQKE